VERERVKVRSGPGRCAYCHDAVEAAERVACATCLAVHHADCWEADARCAACAEATPLVPREETADASDALPAGFVDARAAQETLGLGGRRLRALVQEKRLRAYRGDDYALAFRAEDVERLAEVLARERADRAREKDEWVAATALAIGILFAIACVMALLAS